GGVCLEASTSRAQRRASRLSASSVRSSIFEDTWVIGRIRARIHARRAVLLVLLADNDSSPANIFRTISDDQLHEPVVPSRSLSASKPVHLVIHHYSGMRLENPKTKLSIRHQVMQITNFRRPP
ncbi:hypothetical protein FS842_005743, partial [Serendipita sp. 407]